ncbi:MAG: hypothetical protein ABH824_00095 [Nanoarchaeota archaeon]
MGLFDWFKKKDKFDDYVIDAIKQLVAEFSFFKDLKDDLDSLKTHIDTQKLKAGNDIKGAFRDFRYIGRAEARFYNSEKHVIEGLRLIEKKIEVGEIKVSGLDVNKLMERVKVETNQLLRSASCYEREILMLLTNLQKEVKEQNVNKTKKLIEKIGEIIVDCKEWMGALTSDLNKAQKIHDDSKIKKFKLNEPEDFFLKYANRFYLLENYKKAFSSSFMNEFRYHKEDLLQAGDQYQLRHKIYAKVSIINRQLITAEHRKSVERKSYDYGNVLARFLSVIEFGVARLENRGYKFIGGEKVELIDIFNVQFDNQYFNLKNLRSYLEIFADEEELEKDTRDVIKDIARNILPGSKSSRRVYR